MIWPFHSWVRVKPANASTVPSGCVYTEQCKYCGLIRFAIRRKYPKLTCQPISGYGTELSHYTPSRFRWCER